MIRHEVQPARRDWWPEIALEVFFVIAIGSWITASLLGAR